MTKQNKKSTFPRPPFSRSFCSSFAVSRAISATICMVHSALTRTSLSASSHFACADFNSSPGPMLSKILCVPLWTRCYYCCKGARDEDYVAVDSPKKNYFFDSTMVSSPSLPPPHSFPFIPCLSCTPSHDNFRLFITLCSLTPCKRTRTTLQRHQSRSSFRRTKTATAPT